MRCKIRFRLFSGIDKVFVFTRSYRSVGGMLVNGMGLRKQMLLYYSGVHLMRGVLSITVICSCWMRMMLHTLMAIQVVKISGLLFLFSPI
jgi:hypothetical protein